MDLTDIGCLGYKPLSSLCVDTCDAQKSHDGVRRDARETIGSDGTSDEGKSPVSYRVEGRRTRGDGRGRAAQRPRSETRERRGGTGRRMTSMSHPLVFLLHGVLKLILLMMSNGENCPPSQLLLKL